MTRVAGWTFVLAMAALPVVAPDPYMLARADAGRHLHHRRHQPEPAAGLYRAAQPRPWRLLRARRLCQRARLARLRYRPRLRPARHRSPQPVWVGFLAAILVAGGFGWLLGRLAFRVRGAYFVIITICFAQVLRMIALNWIELTQGPMALIGIPPVTLWLPGLGVTPLVTKAQTYWLVLAVAVLAFLLVRQVVQSRIGRALVALRSNESLARSVGIRVTHYLVVATVISAGIAGAAGSLFAHYVRIVDPDVFLFVYTVTMVIMVVTGGKGTLWGPVVGGLIFGLIPDLLRGRAPPEAQWVLVRRGDDPVRHVPAARHRPRRRRPVAPRMTQPLAFGREPRRPYRRAGRHRRCQLRRCRKARWSA